jgi:hypothetical protein
MVFSEMRVVKDLHGIFYIKLKGKPFIKFEGE